MTEKRICAYCGKEFETTKKRKKFCCVDCRYLYHLEKNRSRTETKLAKMVKKCEYCGDEFTPRRANQRYCSRECATKDRYAQIREEHIQERAAATCLICGKPTNRARTIKYCSKECYAIAQRQKLRERQSKKKEKRPIVPTSEVVRMATEEHLSYGQIVEKYKLY